MDTAFQADAFQTDELAFQIDVGVTPPGPGDEMNIYVEVMRRVPRR